MILLGITLGNVAFALVVIAVLYLLWVTVWAMIAQVCGWWRSPYR